MQLDQHCKWSDSIPHGIHTEQLESCAGWLLANCTNWRWGILCGWCVVVLVFFGRSCFSLFFDFRLLPLCYACRSHSSFVALLLVSFFPALQASVISLLHALLFSFFSLLCFLSFLCALQTLSAVIDWAWLAAVCFFAFHDGHTQQSLEIIWNRPGPAMINLLERVVLRCCCVSRRSGSLRGGGCCCWPYLFIFFVSFSWWKFQILWLVVLISEDQGE